MAQTRQLHRSHVRAKLPLKKREKLPTSGPTWHPQVEYVRDKLFPRVFLSVLKRIRNASEVTGVELFRITLDMSYHQKRSTCPEDFKVKLLVARCHCVPTKTTRWSGDPPY